MTTRQRSRRSFTALLLTSAMILMTMTADAAVQYVTPEGKGAKNGSSWDNAYDEAAFPAAILSAKAGDEIWVKAGVYRPVIPANLTTVTVSEQQKSFVLSNDVALYGGFAGTETSSADRNPAANLTVLTGDLASDDEGKVNGVTVSTDQISGTNSERVVRTGSGCGPTTVLDGFTITAGDNYNDGGGMYTEHSPTVTNCTFSGNRTTANGGGVATSGSHAVIEDCTFSGNSAQNGGGMSNVKNSSPAVTNCTFSGNTATQGGGIFNVYNSAALSGCTFSGNTATRGGGMYNGNDSSPVVTNCTFSENSSGFGGGICNSWTTPGYPVVRSCTFSGNTVTSNGGGMYNGNSAPLVSNCTFSGNTVTSSGGGMYNGNSVPVVRNCTFSGNTAGANKGGGICNNTKNPVVTNCIFWNGSGGEISNTKSTPTVTYCVVSGDDVGTGAVSSDIISADPLLGPLADNGGPTKTHALSAGSSAIDKGMTFDASVISTDQRGVARPQGLSFDVGAYEYGQNLLTVGITGSGAVTRTPSGDVVGMTGKCWSYAKDTPVALTAVEGARDWFVTWSGDATGTAKTASVTMSCDRHVEASFDKAWIVTVSAGPGGDIIASVPGAESAGLSAPDGRGAGTTEVKVRNGRNKIFTVTPNGGYSIGPVLVDDVIAILESGSTYTFPNVSADHTLEATFTANPTPNPSATPAPTAAPTDAPAPTTAPTTNPTSAPTATPTPVPTPDPDIPLPTVTLTITLYAGGTIVAGPFDITDPATLAALLSSQTLLAQLFATAPGAILSGQYNMDLVRFFSLVADLDDGVLDFTILFEVKVEGVPAGYRAQVFVLTRTFDSKGNPTGYAVVPRNEGANVFRKGSGARGWTETWRVTIRDGGATDGDAKQDGSVAPQIAAVVAVFPVESPTVTPTQGSTGSGGGCSLSANGSAVLAALLLLAPVVLLRRR